MRDCINLSAVNTVAVLCKVSTDAGDFLEISLLRRTVSAMTIITKPEA